jgi:hypothetical protein
MSSELKIDHILAKRLQAFICSDLFAVRSDVAKSEYWKHHADQLHATISDDSVSVVGHSVQRVCYESAFFFAASRVEKIPCGPDACTVEQLDRPNRFAEFPWNPQNQELAYEVSRLNRLVSLDGVSIRLERIHK